MEKTLLVDGMKCIHCAKHVEDACLSIKNVTAAKVSLENKNVTITYTEEPNLDDLRTAINTAGHYQAKF
ncbi:MAG: heavy-metal-associated domain-containing protein [Acholeplasmatales bacterium]|nr:heavy-metal-associated domain-containing protein [Acholeplasmatales bacterium]